MRRTAVSLAFFVVALARCSSEGSNGPCTLTAIGAPCTNDTDCCSGYCWLYEDSTTACQTKPATPQACVAASGFCTQDRNCCSGLCDNGSCFGNAGGTSCLSLGSSCIQDDSCCSNDCVDDGQGHTACAPQPQSDGGLNCGLPGAPCTTPGDDPGECCFGLCGPTGSCASGGGGGGGGGNCGASGASCRYGSDCCSGQCEQLSSTSSCH